MSQNPTKQSKLSDLLDPQFMARLDGLDILSRKVLQGKLQGERRAKRRGQSVEFADHRPYVEGDDLRFIDWNVFGRLGQLFLKLFVEEQDLSVQILVDVSGSTGMGEPVKETSLKRLAAALAYIGIVNNNRVTISTFADGLTGQLANMRGRRYVQQMAQFLLAARGEGLTRFAQASRALTANLTGTGVMIVLSDFLFKEGFEEGLRRLIGRKYELYIMQVLSPDEMNPTLLGDLHLIDTEDGDSAEVTVSAALLDYYKKALSAYCNELKEFCTRRGAAYILTDSGQSVEALILNYLRRRGLLK